MNKKVSIIITTKNSAATLMKLLQSVKEQSYANIELIIVDNASTDGTKEIAKKFTKKVFDKGPERSVQRNFGAKKAKGECFLFLDSDMVLEKNLVRECVEKVKNQVGGVVIPEKSFGKGFWARTKALEREINEREPFFEAARFFPKTVFLEFGGYDESLTGPEDWDLPQRVSQVYKISRIKSRILHNEGRPTLFGLAKRKFYYGLSVHKYLKKQNLPVVGPTTVYFLRPAFYRNWRKLLADPLVSLGMLVMLAAETLGGGLGYLVGRYGRG